MAENRERITDVILDFDGTCTQIPPISDQYLSLYRSNLAATGVEISKREWDDAINTVRRRSPHAGWTIAGTPSAPAAGDPYILADETAKYTLRRRGQKYPALPYTANADAYAAARAPWRVEALAVFRRLSEGGIRLHFVSNSSTAIIEQRLDELMAGTPELRGSVSVESDAGKFRVCELPWETEVEIAVDDLSRFQSLPATHKGSAVDSLGRPIYLRRGAYFGAILGALGGNLKRIGSTLVCGDIWEMDLAMPFALGARVHLVHRAAPFDTYEYEHAAVREYGARARASVDLSGLLDWL